MAKVVAAAVALIGGSLLVLLPRLGSNAPATPEVGAAESVREPGMAPPRSRLSAPPTPALDEDPLPRHIAARQAAAALQVELQRILTVEVAPLKTTTEVNAYLAKLEARARAAGRVTFLEVEPGREALLSLPLEFEEAQRQVQLFSDRMAALSAALHPQSPQPGEPQ